MDGILQLQSSADSEYFVRANPRKLPEAEVRALRAGFLEAYRWQYIVTGVQNERFLQVLGAMLNPAQLGRITTALGPIMGSPAPGNS